MKQIARTWKNGDEPPSLQFSTMKRIGSKTGKKALRLYCAAGNANDGHLAGLLTHASPNLKRFFFPWVVPTPRGNVAPGFSESSCGQWRILTALPITRWRKL